MVCDCCGLPKKLCVCEAVSKIDVKRDIDIKKLVAKILMSISGKYKDDFSYCEICGCFHYKGMHVKSFKNG